MLTVLSKVWDSVSGGLTERFLARVVGPAILFWGIGALAYAWSRDLVPTELFEGLQRVSLGEGVIYALLVALLLLFSNAVMEVMQRSVLRGLEGYLPKPLRKILEGTRGRTLRRKVAADRRNWKLLAETYASHGAEERHQYRQLDRKLSYYPENDYQLKPTMIGNVLAAAESYAWERYGLASVLMWPRLWLVMDEGSRNEITRARSRLDISVQFLAWSGVSLVWVMWAWWVFPVASTGLFLTYRLAVGAASGYGELIKSSFDVHHRTLLQRAGLLQEKETFVPYERGRSLTMFVKRGIRPAAPVSEPGGVTGELGRKLLDLALGRPPSED